MVALPGLCRDRELGAFRAPPGGTCRNIRTLRPPFAEHVTDGDVRAAALQYVRKVSGFQRPAAHNAAAFDRAVDSVAEATATLLADLDVRGTRNKQV